MASYTQHDKWTKASIDVKVTLLNEIKCRCGWDIPQMNISSSGSGGANSLVPDFVKLPGVTSRLVCVFVQGDY